MSKALKFVRETGFAGWALGLLAAILISLGTGWSWASVVAIRAADEAKAVKSDLDNHAKSEKEWQNRMENKLDRLLERTRK